MLSIRPVVSSTKLFAIAIILSTSAAAAAEARDRAAALALFFCICIALALPARQCTPCLPGRSRHLSRIPPSLPPFSLLACSPLPNVLMCGKRWCCCSCCCHEAFATFLLRATLRKGMQRRRSHPFRPLIHSLTHSFIQSFIQTLMQLSFIQTAVDAAMNALPSWKRQRQFEASREICSYVCGK